MSKKGTKALASATLMSLVLTTALSAGPVKAAAGQVTRLGAADRYATAAQVATTNWKDGAKDVVLVSGEGYADAVSASALAKQLNAPILLTTAGSLNTDAKAALATLKPTNVYVVGGNASVSAAVRSDLKAANYNLVELQGANRYETNVKVAQKLVELGVKADNVLLVGGEGFSDALSVAPVAAAKGQILLLGNNSEDSMKSVIDFVTTNKSKVTVVGTSNVISDAMYSKLGAVERVNGGATRFETNMNVLNKFATDLKADKLFVANASGNGYADALVASALAGKTASPLVLVDAEGSAATTKAVDYIKATATKTTDLNVVGGTGVVSATTVDAINNAVNPTQNGGGTGTTTNVSVSSVSAVNLRQIKVVFSGKVQYASAQNISNYKLDGDTLTNATANLLNDQKTVIITLDSASAYKQNTTKSFEVKDNQIQAKDTGYSVPGYETNVTFASVVTPTVSNVSVKGGKKLTITFSEAVKSDVATNSSNYKIDGQSLGSFGGTLNKVTRDVNGVMQNADINNTTPYVNEVSITFDSAIKGGSHTLTVGAATNADIINLANFALVKSDNPFTVDTVTGEPSIVSATGKVGGEITLVFDRELDSSTVNINSFAAPSNSNVVVQTVGLDANDSSNKTVKIQTNATYDEGTSTIKVIEGKIKDIYGNYFAATDDKTVSFTVAKDNSAPVLTDAYATSENTIRVIFDKSVDQNASVLVDNGNIKLKDVDGNTVYGNSAHPWASVTRVANNSAAYDLTMTNDYVKLGKSNYTLDVKNISDVSGNIMVESTKSITTIDNTNPKLLGVYNNSNDFFINVNNNTAKLVFSEPMESNTATNTANYLLAKDGSSFKALPSGTTITLSDDGKSVTFNFPSNTVASAWITNHAKMKAINVQDAAGNVLDSSVEDSKAAQDISGLSINAPDFVDNLKLTANDYQVTATVDTTQVLDSIDKNDFKIATAVDGDGYLNIGSTGVAPDSVLRDGKTLTITWSKVAGVNDPYTIIKNAGKNVRIKSGVTFANTVNADGVKLNTQNEYDATDSIAPKFVSAALDVAGLGYTNTISVAFNEDINNTADLYAKDVAITISGKTVSSDDIVPVVVGNTIKFNVKSGYVSVTDPAKVTIKFNGTVNIADKAGNKFAPNYDQKTGNITETDNADPTVVTMMPAVGNITANGTKNLVFSEALNAASKASVKTAVDAALAASGNATVTTAWSGDTTLVVTVDGITVGTDYVAVSAIGTQSVTDLAGNTATVAVQ